ncbi:VanZ family protein [Bacillus sp. Marseille-P3661]|uniref:VanZ family protein n=1 Tax=Bacillus sp. Marseille-P3661 TaxID=1936234 RepID=UPI0015E1942A|nr:VanZ family protein [Bacillus sp. Marseille-P3661]
MKRKFVNLLFFAYMTLLFYLLFFSSYRQSVQGVFDYNLIPFTSILRDFNFSQGFSLRFLTNNLIGNILAFIPFGFFMPLLFHKINTYLKIVISSAVFSLSIECMQISFRLGAFDIDDIILNTIGGMLGFCCWEDI